ncbi:MAG TPA: NRDE family protein [Polyangiaceae bacterium]|nr:NRDE family protein [Polyangiaceae bacterium]
MRDSGRAPNPPCGILCPVCLIAFAQGTGENLLVLAANRDEDHARPTLAAGPWTDAPDVFGGRDARDGGTWLGVARAGRLAAVTNVRGGLAGKAARSRGALCRDFLIGDEDAASYGRRVVAERAIYADFNLLVCDGRSLFYVNRSSDTAVRVAPGVHGLSNAALDVPWPKVERSTAALRRALDGPPEALGPELFAMLADRSSAPNDDLPDTGLSRELERDLAPIFIASAVYGTRSSTVILWRKDGTLSFEERSFGPNGVPTGAVRRELDVPRVPSK